MRRLRVLHRIAAWLALSGMALSALWPLAAIAAPRISPGSVEVCSAHRYHLHGAVPVKPPHGNVHASHCALCTFHAQWNTAIPATALPSFAPARTAENLPERDRAHPVGAARDRTAPPRAPPSFS